jgi:hypothetical protein
MLLVVQAAVLTTVAVREPAGSAQPTLASHENGTQRAVVRFTANASLADVTRFLDANHAAVVSGPSRGMYEIQLAASPMPEADFTRAIQRMKTESRIVEFIAIKN